jgi:hypothetical protein
VSFSKEPYQVLKGHLAGRDGIKKMVPAMEGDIARPLWAEVNNVSEGWHFGISPDMEGTIFYTVSKAPRI